MEVINLVCGAFQTNTYILKSEDKAIIIDPTGKVDKIVNNLDGIKPLAIILTHGHFDHIGCVDALMDLYHIDCYLHEGDSELAHDEKLNSMGQYHAKIKHKERKLCEGLLSVGPFNLNIYHTPGHTEGSSIIIINNCMFAGDVLFKGSIGRTDLYSGNDSLMKQSLKFIKSLNPNLTVYPGHGESTVLSDELKFNYYLR